MQKNGDFYLTFNILTSQYILVYVYMFYQLLHVQHGCSSTQSWGNILSSIVETRDQNSRGCPLLFLKSYTPTAFEKLWITPGIRCMKQASS